MTDAKESEILAALERIEARLAKLEAPSGKDRAEANANRAMAAGKPATPAGGNDEETWLEIPEEQVAALMGPFANAQRVKLLKALYLGMTETTRLKDFTGLSGGQLYHHLKELALAKFLSRQVRGEYTLSSFGYYTFSSLMIMAADLCAQEMDEELAGPEEIGELV